VLAAAFYAPDGRRSPVEKVKE